MYFWSYGLWKTWLDKYLKESVLEDPSTSNMVNGPKDCSKLNDSTFTILIRPSEDNSGLKSFWEWYAKSWDCWLTHWHSITSIFFLIETIYGNALWSNHLRSEKYVLNFFFRFLNFDSILKFFKKKIAFIA